MEQLDQKTINELRQKCKDSLFFLARAVLQFSDFTKHVHRPICKTLQDYEKNTRALIVLPRDWFKSTIGSIAYPIWRAINDPNVRILIVQNSFSNACKKLNAIKKIFECNDLFRALFPELLPDSSCVWSKECLTVKRNAAHPEGTFEAAGTGTAVISRHYDLIIEDDTVAPEKDSMSGISQQPSKMEIEKAIGWHRLATPLLLHPKKSQIIIIGTRWAEMDLIGWVTENSPEYVLISRAVRENENGDARDKEHGGLIVWERFDDEVLTQMERDLGPYMFASLMMNNPTDCINQVFQMAWVRYYDSVPKNIICCTSVDPACAENEESSDPDYTVILTTGVDVKTKEIYVIHYTRERMNPGSTINAIIDHYRTYMPVTVKVESIAYQRTLNYWLRKRQQDTNMIFAIDEIKGLRGSKVDRIRGLQPYFAANKIAVRTHMTELVKELLAFPKGAHDDIIDALTMHIDFWFEACEQFDENKEQDLAKDPMSGQSIINELLGREINRRIYPNDMGLMGERTADSQYREYAHVG